MLEIKDLVVRFKSVTALNKVDLTIDPQVITGIAGESGCGKTTLAKTILGFLSPESGTIFYDKINIADQRNQKVIRENIQIVFQNPWSSLDPRFTIKQVLAEADLTQDFTKNLSLVGLGQELLTRYPHQLSGGQLQRVCIARALAKRPKLVILDEPTSSLDLITAVGIVDLIRKINQQTKVGFLFISHNLKLLKNISDYCYIMRLGTVVEQGVTQSLYSQPRQQYTKDLLSAVNYSLKD